MKSFCDTNVLIYAFVIGPNQATAQARVSECAAISVQVLNEFVNATAKKLRIPWPEIQRALEAIDKQFPDPLPLTREIHRTGMVLCRDHSIAFYDALIVAAAIEADCDRLHSEDLQHKRRFGDCVVINPFRDGRF